MEKIKVNDYINLNLSLKEIAYKILDRFFLIIKFGMKKKFILNLTKN